MSLIERLLEEAATDGVITCPECGNLIEPDCEVCCCSWENYLLKYGYL